MEEETIFGISGTTQKKRKCQIRTEIIGGRRCKTTHRPSPKALSVSVFVSSVAWTTRCKNSCKAFTFFVNKVGAKFPQNKGHSEASVMMKKHRTLGNQMLSTLSMLGQMLRLFPEPVEARKLRKCREMFLPSGSEQIPCHWPSHVCFGVGFPVERPSIQVLWVRRRLFSRHDAR